MNIENQSNNFSKEDEQTNLWIKSYGDSLMNYLYGMVLNWSDAEDIWQETFIKVFQSKNSYKNQGFEKTWIFKIAKNTLIDFTRKENRRPKIIEIQEEHSIDLEDASHSLENKEILKKLNQAVTNLPTGQREIYLLRQRSDLTFKEISTLLNEPQSRILGRMHLAVKKIKESIEGEL
jgi:RNA polymerase sigma-70 factor, ECF subfamily